MTTVMLDEKDPSVLERYLKQFPVPLAPHS